MTQPPTDAARVSMSPARKALILALPVNGAWGRAPNRDVARRAWETTGLVDHRHCPPSPGEEWRLSERGQRIAAAIRETNDVG